MLVLAIACSSSGSGNQQTGVNDPDSIKMKLQVDLSQLNFQTSQKSKASINDVTNVTGEIQTNTGFTLNNITFYKNNEQLWITETLQLPSKQILFLSVSAYDIDDTMIYSGELEFTASESVNLVVPIKSIQNSINKPPVIRKISLPQIIEPGEIISIASEAIDYDDDTLSYLWSTSSGNSIGTSTSNTFTWQAPDSEGTQTIKLSVFDGSDQTDISLEVNVTYHGESQLSLIFLPTVIGFHAIWLQDGELEIHADINYDTERTLTYKWMDDNGNILSLNEYINIIATEQNLNQGLNLELSYTNIEYKVIYKYPLEDQVLPIIEYLQ